MTEQWPSSSNNESNSVVQSKLKSEDPKLFDYLVSKVAESSGQGSKPAAQEDVLRMANSIAVQEERKGMMMSREYIDSLFTEGDIDMHVDSLIEKLHPQEDPSIRMHIADAGGVIHTAASKKELMDKAEQERTSDK